MAEALPKWIEVQKKTFTKWANSHLKKKSYDMLNDLQTDFDTGINLMRLINALYDTELPAKYNKAPKMRPHKLDNCELALNMLKTAGVKTNFLGTIHLVDHDLKMLLGMVWCIILHFQINGINIDDMNAKEGLLLWVQRKTNGYRDVDVNNFTSHWHDGLAFNALIHKFRPDLLDYDSLSKSNAAHNLQQAFDLAEQHFGIPKLLDVEDMLDPLNIDEKSVICYVSEYYLKFSELEKAQAHLHRLKRFLQLAKMLDELKAYYNQNSGPFVDWINQSIQMLESPYDNTVDALQNALNKLAEWQANQKAGRIAEKYVLQGKYHNAVILAEGNNMPKFTPEVDADQIESLWHKMTAAEQARAAKLKELLTKHFSDVFKKFDKDNNNTLNKGELKATFTALGAGVTEEEIDQLLATGEVDKDGVKQLGFDGFLQYMLQYIQTTDSKDDIKKAFKIVAGGKDHITGNDMIKLSLDDELTQYTTTAMPGKGDGYDYDTFTENQFS